MTYQAQLVKWLELSNPVVVDQGVIYKGRLLKIWIYFYPLPPGLSHGFNDALHCPLWPSLKPSLYDTPLPTFPSMSPFLENKLSQNGKSVQKPANFFLSS